MIRGRADGEPDQTGSGGSPGRPALVRFMVSSLVVLVVLVIITVVVAERIARRGALEEARAEATALAGRLVAPLVDAAVRDRTGPAMARLDRELSDRVADGSLSRVKLWDADGRIIWSDQPELVGTTYELPDDVAVLFGTEGVTAELSDLSRAENRTERAQGQLLEVYAGAVDADGVPFVFEAYLPIGGMQREEARIVASFVPLVVGALLLFQLVVAPLAISLSRRVERSQRRSSRMMTHALHASDLERRRMAAELHDGVIQEFAGLGYALPRLMSRLRAGGDPEEALQMLESATRLVQGNVATLRSMTTDLYPPDLEREGLGVALQELVRQVVRDSGLQVDLVLAPALTTSPDAGRLAYRVVREGLRNVVKHADATVVRVEVGQSLSHVLVRVVDDGLGATGAPGTAAEGHLGLRLLRDTMEDFGGALELQQPSSGGTTLLARFPVELVET